MVRRSDSKKTLGYILLGLGAGLAIWAWNQSGTFGAQLTEAVTGSQTDQVMLLFIAAAACIGTGLVLALKK